MWKYQCKRHLLLVLGGMLVGVVLFHDVSVAALAHVMESFKDYPEVIGYLKADYMPYIASLLYGGGMVNAFLLIYYLMQRYNAMLLLLALLILNPLMDAAFYIGVIGLFPCIAVCIYGILTMPNHGKHKAFEKNQVNTVTEIERVYRLHHTYREEYEAMAKKVWLTNLAVSAIYALGVFGMVMIILYVEEFSIMLIAVVLYTFILFGMIRKRNEIMQPIISLLYESCDPEACASVIFALARRSYARRSFPLGQYLAQCMIYLNDPHLAIDVLACTKHTNVNTMLPYHSIMAYANYLLGDESEVRRHYEQCEAIAIKGMNSPLAAIKQQYLESISNKLDLMKQDFDKSRKFYTNAIEMTTFEFQRIDFKYYLGLIAFVQKEYMEARSQFSYVAARGNGLYFVEKAKNFLEMIEKLDQDA